MLSLFETGDGEDEPKYDPEFRQAHLEICMIASLFLIQRHQKQT